ncbi:putative E3 ubiquitin-protein ligase ptr1 [Blattamonas nauphoetae]|uniref:HECT-type E3 ubiquitin transferase n=1 Tax=Blattamonas nauphoetae TaxID=2049346 RepID=A0ABQ9WTY6_9EUKA|nr:putative E3 ubiquitin-protein ligase ptr1 [Blattamonas nauphoetae]
MSYEEPISLAEIYSNSRSITEAFQYGPNDIRLQRYKYEATSAHLKELEDERTTIRDLPSEVVVQYDHVEVTGDYYQADMLVDYRTNLKLLMRSHKPKKWSKDECLKVIAQVAQSLSEIHKTHAHLNLVSQSIYLPSSGPAKIADFFYAKPCDCTDDDETVDEPFPFEKPHRAPETYQEGGIYNSKVDIWALGLLAWELATGEHYYTGISALWASNIFKSGQSPAVPTSIDSQLRELIEAMLTFDYKQRPSAQQLTEHPLLKPFIEATPAPPQPREHVPSPATRPFQPTFAKSPEEQHDLFLKQLKALKSKVPTNQHNITFPHDTNIVGCMKIIYGVSLTQIKQPWYVNIDDTTGVDINGIKRWFFSEITGKLLNPAELPLFIPDKGADGKLTISNESQFQRPEYLQFYKFVGLLIGKCLLEGLFVEFRFNDFIWRQLLGYPLHPSDLQFIQRDLYQSFQTMLTQNYVDSTQTFTVRINEQNVPLIPNGENTLVKESEIQDYVDLACLAILNQYTPLLTAMRTELHTLVPESILRLLTPEQIALQVCGMGELDVADWKENTHYESPLTENHPVAIAFWGVIDAFDNEQRKKVLRLGTGLTNAPPTGFKHMKASPTSSTGGFNLKLLRTTKPVMPEGHMCFCRLDIPQVTDVDVMKNMIMRAMAQKVRPND